MGCPRRLLCVGGMQDLDSSIDEKTCGSLGNMLMDFVASDADIPGDPVIRGRIGWTWLHIVLGFEMDSHLLIEVLRVGDAGLLSQNSLSML